MILELVERAKGSPPGEPCTRFLRLPSPVVSLREGGSPCLEMRAATGQRGMQCRPNERKSESKVTHMGIFIRRTTAKLVQSVKLNDLSS